MPSTRPHTSRASRTGASPSAAGRPTLRPTLRTGGGRRSSRSSAARSVGFLESRALLLALDHLGDQLLYVGVAAGLDVARLDRPAIALQGAALGQLVELRPVDLNQDALVLRQILADIRPRHLDPVELDVPPAPQLQPEDQFELLQGGDFRLESLDRSPDQVWSGGQPKSCASAGASCRSPCAGSPRFPRRSGATARRGKGARSRTPSSSRSRRECESTPRRTPCRSPRRAASPSQPRDRSARRRPSSAPLCGGRDGPPRPWSPCRRA